MRWLDWVVMTACLTWTLVLFLHVARLYRAWEDDDPANLQAMTRLTMRLVGMWQIILGVSMLMIGQGWTSTITLVGCGVGLLLLDWIKRKFDRAMDKDVQTDIT